MTGRLHDSRHALITELAESGAGDQTIMDIAGHASGQMLKHYSHIREFEALHGDSVLSVGKASHVPYIFLYRDFLGWKCLRGKRLVWLPG